MIRKQNELSKTKTHPSIYQEKFRNIHQYHPDLLYVFTDGFWDSDKTVCAAVLNKIIIKKARPMENSIPTAEIDLTFDIISKNKHKKFIIF